jgi:hypothetical protein
MGRFFSSLITTPYWIALTFLLVSIGAVSFDKMVIGFGRFVGILFTTIDQVQQEDKPDPPRSLESGQ